MIGLVTGNFMDRLVRCRSFSLDLTISFLNPIIGGIGVWSFFVFGTIILLNIWSYFLVMVCAKRKGDIGIVRIVDDDIIRFIWMSGLFGAWAAILCK